MIPIFFYSVLAVQLLVASPLRAESVIPFEYKNTEATTKIMIVQASANGQALRFSLDTGAAKSLLFDSKFSRQYKSTASAGAIGVGGVEDQFPVVRVSGIKFGGISLLSPQEFLVLPARKEWPIDGVIGIDAFFKFRFTIDFFEHKISLEPKAPNALLPILANDFGLVHLDISLSGQKFKALVDTGVFNSLVSEDFYLAHRSAFRNFSESIEGRDLNGKAVRSDCFIVHDLTIAGLQILNQKVCVTSAPFKSLGVDMLLGESSLQDLKWYFDIPNGKWSATRY